MLSPCSIPLRRPKVRVAANSAVDLTIFVAATSGTYVAQLFDRPISAVLCYLVGVTLIGARSGLVMGLTSAVLASIIYNFFLSEPVFRFGASSMDDLIPLIAFNISAVVTGGMAGRLKDSARQALAAEARSAYHLLLSDQLQRALTVADVLRITRDTLPFEGVNDLDLFLLRGGHLYSANQPEIPVDPGEAFTNRYDGTKRDIRFYTLWGADEEIGLVRFHTSDVSPTMAGSALQGVVNILGLAVDRCRLLDRLAENRAQQKGEELKAALVSSVSHDLRTPLTAIEAAAGGLRSFDEELSSEQRRELLDTISEQCRKLNRYTANLLDMSRIQSGIPDHLLVDVDLAEILGVALSSVRSHHPSQEIEKHIELRLAPVLANAAMLEQLIFNLLENAIVHGGETQPINVGLVEDQGNVVLSIKDYGPGIEQSEQEMVFQRFYRSRSSAHREGSGLGLHIAQGFAEAFNGQITLRSPHEDGSGTEVTLILPLAHFRAAEAQENAAT